MADQRKKQEIIKQAKQISDEISKHTINKKSEESNNNHIIENKNMEEIKEEVIIEDIKEHSKKSIFRFQWSKENIILLGFIVPPIVISVISMLHLWDWFKIANSPEGAFVLAACFELVSIASLLALASLERITKWGLWIIFFLVAAYQIVGNVYASYMIASSNEFLMNTFTDMFWFMDKGIRSVRWIAFLQGAILPILSLSLLKLAVDYLTPKDKDGNIDRSKTGPMFYQRKR